MRTITAVIGFAAVASVEGHSAATFPPPRNAIDSDEMPWGGAVPADIPFEPWCPFPSESAASSDPGRNVSGANGQACFWFSNGCTTGCSACDGSTRGPIPVFHEVDGKILPVKNATDSGTGKAVAKLPACSLAQSKNATVCDPAQRTVNTEAECGGDDDFYFYSPWRAPGSAPVIDACGTAGGRVPGQGPGGYGAEFVNTTHAQLGDLGSELPHMPSGVTWRAGSSVDVAWTLQANHGGGYGWRLCSLEDKLEEACFQKTPLDFVSAKTTFRWGGAGGKQTQFENVIVQGDQTTPAGSQWKKNPVPRAWQDADGQWDAKSNQLQTGVGFAPLCDNKPPFVCTGMWGPYNLEIIDEVVIPAGLAPGRYVLGFRQDCEESSQIWSSCSDVTVVA